MKPLLLLAIALAFTTGPVLSWLVLGLSLSLFGWKYFPLVGAVAYYDMPWFIVNLFRTVDARAAPFPSWLGWLWYLVALATFSVLLVLPPLLISRYLGTKVMARVPKWRRP